MKNLILPLLLGVFLVGCGEIHAEKHVNPEFPSPNLTTKISTSDLGLDSTKPFEMYNGECVDATFNGGVTVSIPVTDNYIVADEVCGFPEELDLSHVSHLYTSDYDIKVREYFSDYEYADIVVRDKINDWDILLFPLGRGLTNVYMIYDIPDYDDYLVVETTWVTTDMEVIYHNINITINELAVRS